VLSSKLSLPTKENALKGRSTAMQIENSHYVHGHSIQGPFLESLEQVYFGMGCFWGAERKFWSLNGVVTTAVGYGGGFTENPTYEEVCSGKTAHNELVLVMRQGNDKGTQYRSGIYGCNKAQLEQAKKILKTYQSSLDVELPNNSEITTEVFGDTLFYYAETYHQQYLAKNPNGYCGLNGTGVKCSL